MSAHNTTGDGAQPRLATAQTAAELDQAEGELSIRIRPYDQNYWEYYGTRALLESEGVIEADIEWPEGSQSLEWRCGRFRWSLRRVRPKGMKGPMNRWTTGDFWQLRCTFLDGLSAGVLLILQKKAALVAELHRQSEAGLQESIEKYSRYGKTLRDKRFQAFKALIPGLTRPKRGRTCTRGQVSPGGTKGGTA